MRAGWRIIPALLSLASTVSAQEPVPAEEEAAQGELRPVNASSDDEPTGDTEDEHEQNAEVDPRSRRHPAGAILSQWSATRKRWFLSARADVGFLFFRPRVSFGYGIPHDQWSGLDVVPIVSGTQGGGYVGLRYRHPRFEIRSGGLYSGAFYRGFLPAADRYDSRDLELEGSPVARFAASDSELTISVPLGPGYASSETQAIVLLASDPEDYVFVETLGVIVAPPWAIREQIRYTFKVPGIMGMFLGPAVEAVVVPERRYPVVVRAGATLRFWLYQDLQLRTDVIPTVYSPDTLGRDGAPWLTVSARFLWATD